LKLWIKPEAVNTVTKKKTFQSQTSRCHREAVTVQYDMERVPITGRRSAGSAAGMLASLLQAKATQGQKWLKIVAAREVQALLRMRELNPEKRL
jgi:hypothetical protein